MAVREDYLKALGPLTPLYAEKMVTEIIVDSPQRILVERNGKLEAAAAVFDSSAEIQKVIDALVALSGIETRPGQSIFELSFPGGEGRAVAVLPPTSSAGPILVIRKLMRTEWITWDKLVEFGSVSAEAIEFLKHAVFAPVNILISGGAGAGKTTIANRVVELIPAEERVIVVERDREMQARHPGVLYLQAGGPGKVAIDGLILTASKMRPDWLIVGELMGAEAMTAVEVLGRGHSGMVTMHAESVEDSLARLEAMCLTANLGLRLDDIRGLIAAAFGLVLHQKRLPNGKRVIVEIAELRGLEQGRYVLNRLFRYNLDAARLEATGMKPGWQD